MASKCQVSPYDMMEEGVKTLSFREPQSHGRSTAHGFERSFRPKPWSYEREGWARALLRELAREPQVAVAQGPDEKVRQTIISWDGSLSRRPRNKVRYGSVRGAQR